MKRPCRPWACLGAQGEPVHLLGPLLGGGPSGLHWLRREGSRQHGCACLLGMGPRATANRDKWGDLSPTTQRRPSQPSAPSGVQTAFTMKENAPRMKQEQCG